MERLYAFNEQSNNIIYSSKNEIYEQLLNLYKNDNVSILSDTYDKLYLSEGANTEYTKLFVDHFKLIKESSTKGKKCFKSGDFKNAKINYITASKECEKLYSDFDNVEDTVLSTIIGDILYLFISAAPIIIASLMVEYIAAIIIVSPAILATAIQELLEIITTVKDWKDDDMAKNFNFYKTKLKTGIKILDGCYKKKIKQCDEAIKKK